MDLMTAKAMQLHLKANQRMLENRARDLSHSLEAMDKEISRLEEEIAHAELREAIKDIPVLHLNEVFHGTHPPPN